MKLSYLVDNIAIKLGKNSDVPFKRILRDDIIAQRAVIIKQDYERNRMLPSSLYQTIKCAKVEQVRDLDCVDCVGKTVWKTEKKIPKPILFNNSFEHFTITNPLKSNRGTLGVLKVEELEFLKFRRFTQNAVYCVYENEWLYFYNVPIMESVSVRGVFENPLTVLEMYSEDSCCDDCESVISQCFLEGDLNIEDSYVDRIKAFIYKENERIQPQLDTQIEDATKR